MFLRCLFTLLIALSGTAFAGVGSTFVPKRTDLVQTLKPFAAYLEDVEGKFEIENVANGTAGDFHPLATYKTAGFTSTVYWLRVTIDLRTFEEPFWYFRKEYIPTGSMTVYSPTDDGRFFHAGIDESEPNAGRYFSTRNFLFKIPTKASTVTYFVRIDPRFHPANLELTWASEKALLEDTHDSQMWLGLFYGGCGVMLFYNAFLFFATRDKAYIYYTYFLCCFVIVFANYNGLLSFIFRYSEFLAKFIVLSLYGMQHGGTLYARSFMDLKSTLPWADKLLRGLQWFLVAGVIATPFLPQKVAFQLALSSIPVILVTALLFSIYRWWSGYEPAKIFCLGWLVLGFTGIHFTVVNLGVASPSGVSTYGVLFGSLWEIVMSSLALAYRIKVLEKEKETALTQSNQDLEAKVFARTKALEESRDLYLKSDSDKRKLIQKVNSAVEDERKAIAVEIHDELNASLIAMQLDLQSILDITEGATSLEEIPKIREKAITVINTNSVLYARGRSLVRRLRPEVLDLLGLHGAVEEIVKLYDGSHPGCQFSLESTGDLAKLDGNLSMAAYRVIQEGLSNVVKHANASHVLVMMGLSADDNSLEITIQDDGVGFDKESVTPGIGLIGINERVHAFKGQIQINTLSGLGTKIVITLPVNVSNRE